MTTRGDNIWTFVLLMTGPIVWMGQFVLIYALAGLGCSEAAASAENNRLDIAGGVIAAVSVAFLLGFILFRFVRPTYLQEFAGAEWARSASIGLALLSILAIVWGTAPLALLSPCSG